MNTRYRVVVEGDEQSNYSAYSPDVPGVVATGPTRESCVAELHSAIAFHREGSATSTSVPAAPSR